MNIHPIGTIWPCLCILSSPILISLNSLICVSIFLSIHFRHHSKSMQFHKESSSDINAMSVCCLNHRNGDHNIAWIRTFLYTFKKFKHTVTYFDDFSHFARSSLVVACRPLFESCSLLASFVCAIVSTFFCWPLLAFVLWLSDRDVFTCFFLVCHWLFAPLSIFRAILDYDYQFFVSNFFFLTCLCCSVVACCQTTKLSIPAHHDNFDTDIWIPNAFVGMFRRQVNGVRFAFFLSWWLFTSLLLWLWLL